MAHRPGMGIFFAIGRAAKIQNPANPRANRRRRAAGFLYRSISSKVAISKKNHDARVTARSRW